MSARLAPATSLLTDRWAVPIVLALAGRPRRYCHLERSLDGITQKVLTQTLRRLESRGVLTRRVLPSTPVGVEYQLTDYGTSLLEPLTLLTRRVEPQAVCVP
ncbi:MAG TPA: helix-turn-helix domain-containing protein [Deinococcales bacterium]|nr:helix-turn-helix domain-containing protein [Deinococcales bacterium]